MTGVSAEYTAYFRRYESLKISVQESSCQYRKSVNLCTCSSRPVINETIAYDKILLISVLYCKIYGGWWRWALVSPDGVAPSQSVCLPLLISPCTIKSRSSLLALAHPGGPGKMAINRY